MAKSKSAKISFVIPVFNEQDGIKNFLDKHFLPEVAKISKYKKEIIFVDDGSSDNTLKIIQDYAATNNDFKIIAFSRNFGKEVALSAGIAHATGEAVIMMDSDGQQPTKYIHDFIKAWENGSDIVTGIRTDYNKGHGLIPRLGSKLFYKLLNKMGYKNTIPGSTDFRLLDRNVVNEYNKLSEHNRITRGLIDWLGFEQTIVEYKYNDRIAGKSSFDFKKLLHLAVNSFISLSTTPLIVLAYIGAFIMIGSFFLGLFVIIQQYILGDPLQLYWNGAVQMSIFITFLVGLILVSQATTALYISHIHAEAQDRPLYIINKKQSRNLEDK